MVRTDPACLASWKMNSREWIEERQTKREKLMRWPLLHVNVLVEDSPERERREDERE